MHCVLHTQHVVGAMQGFGLEQAAMTGTSLYDCMNTQSNPPEQDGNLTYLVQASDSVFE